jgi:hypothetical protein
MRARTLSLPLTSLLLAAACEVQPEKVAAPPSRAEAPAVPEEVSASRDAAARAEALDQDVSGAWDYRGLAPLMSTGIWMTAAVTRTPTGEPGVYRFTATGELYTRDRVKRVAAIELGGETRFTTTQACSRYDSVKLTPEPWTSEDGLPLGSLLQKGFAGPTLDKLPCASLRAVRPDEITYDLDGLSYTERPARPAPTPR